MNELIHTEGCLEHRTDDTPNEIEVIVQKARDLHDNEWCLKGCTTRGDKPTVDALADFIRTTLTQLNANRTAEMEAMVREILAKSNLVENTIEHGDIPIDGSFYQIYRGHIKEIAQAHGITIN